jgi:hypothetical protein
VAQIDISGYIETRPYLTWNDSVHILGYNRGWLEFKSDGLQYGTQLAFDLIIPYDTTSFNYVVENIAISRLALWLGPENMRIVAGRQRLYWGVARVFRPLDVFNPINFFEPGYERPGSNALLGYIALGHLTSIRGVVVPEHTLEKTFTGLRIGTNVFANDIGLNIMHRAQERKTILGAELTGELEVGYWGELSYVWEDTLDYPKFSVSIDYTFPFMVYTMLEYFFDGSGETESQNYDFLKITRGERTTLAQQYVYTTVSFMHNPFLRPAVNAVINVNDGGFILIPQIYYAIYENAEIVSGLNIFIGSDESEFSNITPYNGAVYIWAKVYF